MFKNIFPSSESEKLKDFEFIDTNAPSKNSVSPKSESKTTVNTPLLKNSFLKEEPKRIFGLLPFGKSVKKPQLNIDTSSSQSIPVNTVRRGSKGHNRTTSMPYEQVQDIVVGSPEDLFEKFAVEYREKEKELKREDSALKKVLIKNSKVIIEENKRDSKDLTEPQTPISRLRAKSNATFISLKEKEVVQECQKESEKLEIQMKDSKEHTKLETIQLPQDLSRKQKFVIIKYFEEKVKHAKIIKRSQDFIIKMRNKLLNISEEQQKNEPNDQVEALILIQLIIGDDVWLNKESKIKNVLYFDQNNNFFNEVPPKQIFVFKKDGSETIITFHIIREKKPTKLIEEKYISYVDVQTAKKEVNELCKGITNNGEPDITVRCYDLEHHGYMRMNKGDIFPISKEGATTVKILIEKHIIEQEQDEEEDEDKKLFLEKEVLLEDNGRSVEIYNGIFSEFVDRAKIPVKEHIRSDIEEIRAKKWSKVNLKTDKVTSLKYLIRLGIPFYMRKDVYLILTGVNTVNDLTDRYQKIFEKVFCTFYKKKDLKPTHVNPSIFPEFGGKLDIREHYLTKEGIEAVKRILCCLAYTIDIEYSPSIVTIICLLLTIMPEAYVFCVLEKMMERSVKDNWWFRTKKLSHQLYLEAFKDVLKKNLPNVKSHLDKLDYDIESASKSFHSFFFNYFPFDWRWRILDSFMSEGLKVILRAGYSIYKFLEKDILKCKTKEEVHKLLSNPFPFKDEDAFFLTKYRITLKRKQIEYSEAKNIGNIPAEKLEYSITMYTRPKVIDDSEIIQNENQWEIVCSWLPYRLRLQSLYKSFNSSKDGYSLTSLYHSSKDIGPMMILIMACPIVDVDDIINQKKNLTRKTTTLSQDLSKKYVFGAFLGEPIENSNRYEGTADSFVFSLYPKENVYKWAKKNDLFSYGGNERILIGGDGAAISIDENLMYGQSQKSQTFDNEPLLNDIQNFMILKLEVYFWK